MRHGAASAAAIAADRLCRRSSPSPRPRMTVSDADIHQTLEYRTATAVARLLPTGLFLIFAGLFIFALLDADREPLTLVGVALCFLAGGGVIGVALWRRSRHGKPLFA